MSDKEKLAKIKTLHDEANSIYGSNHCADQDRATDILHYLFGNEYTDWLIIQAEKVERYEQALKEICKATGSSRQSIHFQKIAQKVLEASE